MARSWSGYSSASAADGRRDARVDEQPGPAGDTAGPPSSAVPNVRSAAATSASMHWQNAAMFSASVRMAGSPGWPASAFHSRPAALVTGGPRHIDGGRVEGTERHLGDIAPRHQEMHRPDRLMYHDNEVPGPPDFNDGDEPDSGRPGIARIERRPALRARRAVPLGRSAARTAPRRHVHHGRAPSSPDLDED